MLSFSGSKAADASAAKAEMPIAAVSRLVERNMTFVLVKRSYFDIALGSTTYLYIDRYSPDLLTSTLSFACDHHTPSVESTAMVYPSLYISRTRRDLHPFNCLAVVDDVAARKQQGLQKSVAEFLHAVMVFVGGSKVRISATNDPSDCGSSTWGAGWGSMWRGPSEFLSTVQ